VTAEDRHKENKFFGKAKKVFVLGFFAPVHGSEQ
jgi:hypothetical protein